MNHDLKEREGIFLDALTDALGRSDEQSLDEVMDDLKSEGINVEETMARLINMVNKTSKAAKRKQLDLAREERQKKESEFIKLKDKFTDWTRDQILLKIKEILSMSGPDISVAYRELESKDTEDLRSLLEDLEMARKLDEYKNDDEQ